MDVKNLGQQLEHLLGTKKPPIAIAFRDTPPPNVARIATPQPAGCGYWRLAAEAAGKDDAERGEKGSVFYTEASDHFNCPIGAHTHNVAVPPDVGKQLEGLISTMVGLKYLKMVDVPSIPRRKNAFGVAVYAPLASAPCDPDVVLVRGNVRQLMLLAEAAQSAGVVGDAPTLGRPTCAVLPLAIETARTAASFGCIGNRVYTGLEDDEGYFAIPGEHLDAVVTNLATIVNANHELEKFHKARVVASPRAGQ